MSETVDHAIARRLRTISIAISFLTLMFGCCVLVGWAFEVQILKTIVPGQVAVKANTSICFMLLGLILWLWNNPRSLKRSRNLLCAGASVVVGTVGLLSFLEFLTGWNPGIDELLFHVSPEDAYGSVRPGLMSPIAGLAFFLLAPALWTISSKNAILRWSSYLSLLAVAISSTFGVLDFVLDPNHTHTFISPITALVLLLLALAVPLSMPDQGVGSLVASDSSGGTLIRRLLPASIIIPVTLGWLRWQGEKAGLFSSWMGVALMVVGTATLLAGIVTWTAYVANKADWDRNRAQGSSLRLAAIVTSSNEAIIGKTLDGIVSSWNPAAEVIYGYSAQEMIGKPISILIPREHREEFQLILEKVRKGIEVRHYETERLRKDGTRVFVSIAVAPIHDPQGNLLGASTIARDITEQKRAQEELKRASLYARNLIEASLDPLVTISKDGKIMDVNRATELATGVARDQLIGSDFSNYFSEPEKARAGYERVFAEEMVRDYPLVLRHRSGQLMDVLYNATVFRNAAGGVEGVFAAARDVTEQKRFQEELRRASLYARSLIEASLDPLVTISKDGKIMDVNRATELATGVARDDLISTDFSNYFSEPENARAGYLQVFAEETVRDYPLSLRHRSGQLVDVLYNASVFRNAAGEVEGVFAAARDITKRKAAEKALRESEGRYRCLVTATAQVIWTTDAAGEVFCDMPSWRSFTGLTYKQLQGSGWLASLHPDDRKRTSEVWRKAVTSQSLYETEYRLRRFDGEYRHVSARGVPVTDESGDIREWIGVCTDITDRKRAEVELRESEEAFRTLVALVPQMVWMCMPDGLNVYFNERWVEYTGLTLEESYGRGWNTPFHPDDKQSAWDAWNKAVATGEAYIIESRLRAKDGTYRWFLMRGVPLREGSGKIVKWFGTCTDIHDLKEAQAELKQLNQELEKRVLNRTAQLQATNQELEAFTYSVSHDLRAPLRHISGFSKILSEDFAPVLPADAQHLVERISEGTRRMGMLVDDLLNLGRIGRHEVRLQVAGLDSLVADVLRELQPETDKRNVQWKIGRLPYVECDPPLLRQVFQNLLSNALKFTRPREKAIIEIGQEVREGISVVYVRDNGVGFSMKYADKLFGVFQRLHRAEDFEGTGVGLATVERIIRKHGGKIWAEAELDKGAKFYFTLGTLEDVSQQNQAIKSENIHELTRS